MTVGITLLGSSSNARRSVYAFLPSTDPHPSVDDDDDDDDKLKLDRLKLLTELLNP